MEARNIFGGLKQSWTTVSWEPVVNFDPQCIIINDYGTPTAAQKEQFLETSPIARNLTAVKNRSFLALGYDEVTPGPRDAEAVVTIAHWLHPRAFPSFRVRVGCIFDPIQRSGVTTDSDFIRRSGARTFFLRHFPRRVRGHRSRPAAKRGGGDGETRRKPRRRRAGVSQTRRRGGRSTRLTGARGAVSPLDLG